MPSAVIINDVLAAGMGLDGEQLFSPRGIAELSGNEVPHGAMSIAQAYAGHQFGSFTILGDGRAIVLGEHVDPVGMCWDVQLKGAGRTPYSRGGDGKAVLGPMLREYIISEAMHALGIPTTRSLAVVTTGETVWREIAQPGAILTRVAASHIRVGTFQYAACCRDQYVLQALADYAIWRHFPDILSCASPYLDLLDIVMQRQVALIAAWMNVGFVHGVMNTDNMALSGETIDYGPCAFMDRYEPQTVFSSIDRYGRYAFANQPSIALWNLSRFAETLLPLIHKEPSRAITLAEEVLARFEPLYQELWAAMLRKKLGLSNMEKGDGKLVHDLLMWMHRKRADFINTFRALMAAFDAPSGIFADDLELAAWWQIWTARRRRQPQSDPAALQIMQQATPAVIPRNHLVEEVLQAAAHEQNLQPLRAFLQALQDPYDHHRARAYYQDPAPADAPPYRTFCGT